MEKAEYLIKKLIQLEIFKINLRIVSRNYFLKEKNKEIILYKFQNILNQK